MGTQLVYRHNHACQRDNRTVTVYPEIDPVNGTYVDPVLYCEETQVRLTLTSRTRTLSPHKVADRVRYVRGELDTTPSFEIWRIRAVHDAHGLTYEVETLDGEFVGEYYHEHLRRVE